MAAFNFYLNFPGTTEAAFNFYKSVFGGEFFMIQRFKDTPEASRLSGDELEKIMHMSLPLPGGAVLMATDALESMGHPLTVGNNFHISISTKSKEEADIFFAGLSAGGTAVMPPQDMFWGAYFGMLIDPFGIQWMVSYDANHPQ